jgi:uncharacterized protein DUF5336
MSGYGNPQGPTPGSPRSGRSTPALPVLELVGVGLALLAFIVAFLSWAKQDVPDGVSVDGISFSGWDLPLPTAGVTLLLVAGLLTAAPLFAKKPADADSAVSPVPAMLAVLGAVLLVIFAIIGYADGFERGIGAWLGLVLGLGTAAVLELSWMQRTGRVKKPAPAAGPSNWNQGQPGQGQPGQGQGWGQPQAGQPGGYPAQQQPPSYGQQQPPSYGQQPTYGGQGGYPGGPATGGQPAQQPPAYGQDQYPPQSGGYPAQPGSGYPQG